MEVNTPRTIAVTDIVKNIRYVRTPCVYTIIAIACAVVAFVYGIVAHALVHSTVSVIIACVVNQRGVMSPVKVDTIIRIAVAGVVDDHVVAAT